LRPFPYSLACYRISRRSLTLGVALAFPAGCALFQDLDSAPYSLAEAGVEGGACAPDAAADCAPVPALCQSAADCTPGQVCCAALAPQSGATVSCVANAAACTSMGNLAVQLCATAAECGNGGPCTTQSCSSAGKTVSLAACSTIPFCQP
jgi:hypothetical protein